MEIKFNKWGLENTLWKFYLLKSINHSLEMKSVYGNGRGQVTDDLEELHAVTNEIHESFQVLIENTIEFLLYYSTQMENADKQSSEIL